MTEKKYISCIIMLREGILSAKLKAYVYDTNLNSKYSVNLGYSVIPSLSLRYPYFIKCIHLKEEIGVFTFYQSKNSAMVKYPVLLFRENKENGLDNYIDSDIILDKIEMNTDSLLNDLIKINDNKLCFISTNDNKDIMIIVLLNIYNNNEIAQRYYY